MIRSMEKMIEEMRRENMKLMRQVDVLNNQRLKASTNRDNQEEILRDDKRW